MCWSIIRKLLIGGGAERPSPGDWIPWSKITIEGNKLTAQLPPGVRTWLCGVGESGSMDPVLDDGTMCLMFEIKDGTPLTANYLIVGDVAVYRRPTPTFNVLVRHRIIEIGHDEQGRWFKFQGDNPVTNRKPDKWLIRDSMIKWVVVAIFYGEDDKP